MSTTPHAERTLPWWRSAGLASALTLALGLLVGAWLAAAPASPPTATSSKPPPLKAPSAGGADDAERDDKAATTWTCSMHPQIRMPKPGLCPICNMELIPVKPSAGAGGSVTLSAEAAAAAHIATSEVARKAVDVPLRLVGKVQLDETRVSRITAWFGGRIERAYVDFTGTRVRKGDHLVSLYSPELLVAQQELIQASRDARRAPAGPLGAAARATERAARDKLRLWGLMDFQIRSVLRRGKPLERVTIYAPRGGIVVHKAALQGAWVKTGTPLYTIADLSHVWVELDAYESDLAWLRYDQRASFEVAAFPGERFEGRIAFVNPTMDARTRTLKVRLDVANPDLRLKPEMFVRATVAARVGADNRAAPPDLAGHFVCPMHPGEVHDKAERCGICGMKLVPAEKHWLVGPALADGGSSSPLLIPHTAPLYTGRRVVVFVQDPKAERPTYLVREITPGPRAGDMVVVRSGLKEGERVVTRGAFRLDSSMQIAGEASVMNQGTSGEASGAGADGEPSQAAVARQVLAEVRAVSQALGQRRMAALRASAEALARAAKRLEGARGLDQAVVWLVASSRDLSRAKTAFGDVLRLVHRHVPGGDALEPPALPKDAAFTARLRDTLKGALALSAALAGDDLGKAKAAASAMRPAAAALAKGKRPVNPALVRGLERIAADKATMAEARAAFEDVSVALIPLTALHEVDVPYEQVWCPMALDNKGAPWLQAPGEVANPYFGASMLRCGGKVGGKDGGKGGGHEEAQ